MKNLALRGLLLLLSVTALAAPQISNPGFSHGAFQFSVATTSEPHGGYIVEYNNNLGDPSWTVLTTFLGDGKVHLVSDVNPRVNSRFYRVRKINI